MGVFLVLFFSFISELVSAPNVDYVSWQDVDSGCDIIVDNMRKNNCSVDVIVGISRGGLIPARILADRLDIHELYTIKIAFYTAIGKTEKAPKILQTLSLSLKGKTVLLVDDISDLGATLDTAIDYLRKVGVKNLYTATLHVKSHSHHIPNFFAYRSDSWIIYPWEREEGKKELSAIQSLTHLSY